MVSMIENQFPRRQDFLNFNTISKTLLRYPIPTDIAHNGKVQTTARRLGGLAVLHGVVRVRPQILE